MSKHKLKFKLKYDLRPSDKITVNSLSITEIITNGSTYKVYGFGKIVKFGRALYLDQLSGNCRVTNNRFKEYLLSEYNLTEKEYYNIVVYGDIDYTPLCEYSKCRSPLEFLGINVNPSRSYRKYCSFSCETRHRVESGTSHMLSKNRSKYFKDHDEKAKEYGKKLYESGNHPFSDPLNTILATKLNFLANFRDKRNYSIARLYIAYTSDLFDEIKIGVTTMDLRSRANYIRDDSLPYKSIHLLYQGDITEVAELEYLIKLEFVDRRARSNSYEAFNSNLLKEILGYTRKLLRNLLESQ